MVLCSWSTATGWLSRVRVHWRRTMTYPVTLYAVLRAVSCYVTYITVSNFIFLFSQRYTCFLFQVYGNALQKHFGQSLLVTRGCLQWNEFLLEKWWRGYLSSPLSAVSLHWSGMCQKFWVVAITFVTLYKVGKLYFNLIFLPKNCTLILNNSKGLLLSSMMWWTGGYFQWQLLCLQWQHSGVHAHVHSRHWR